jgi:hypothetical protein
MTISGVIFLASYKLANLFASQNREIEKNVAIHQALTAYHRVFEDDFSHPPPPFQKLINQLHRLRNSQSVGTEGEDWEEKRKQKKELQSDEVPAFQRQKFVYSHEELRKLRGEEEKEEEQNEVLRNPILSSYQKIASSAESTIASGSSSSRGSGSSNKKKKNTKPQQPQQQKKTPAVSGGEGAERGEWGRAGGPTLDHLLDSVLGTDHHIHIVREKPEDLLTAALVIEGGAGATELESLRIHSAVAPLIHSLVEGSEGEDGESQSGKAENSAAVAEG